MPIRILIFYIVLCWAFARTRARARVRARARPIYNNSRSTAPAAAVLLVKTSNVNKNMMKAPERRGTRASPLANGRPAGWLAVQNESSYY